jgi:5-methyltetrahydropteroyltriglutamate--homocysteine methyltransferase
MNSNSQLPATTPAPHTRQLPRADQVGSLLRPQALLDARARHAQGIINAAALQQVEDECIAAAVQRQQQTGIGCITDGEFRRSYFHLDFFSQLAGVTLQGSIAASSDAGERVSFTPPRLAVSGKLQHSHPIMQRDCEFLQSLTPTLTKITIPSPSMLHFRGGRAAIDAVAYPDLGEFFADLAGCYQEEIRALYAAGCRYLQLDDTNLAYLCDPRMRADAAARGEDPDALPQLYARLINSALAGRAPDLKVGIHLCRGNYRSTWFASGGYEPVADVLFNQLDVDAYLLEFDDARSGDFSPLRFVPADKRVVLGLVSSKLGELEARDDILRRIEEASSVLPLEQLALSPQCGFASTAHGNALSEQQQWDKLRLVAELAQEVWSDAG